MNHTRCKSCKKQHTEKLNYQQHIVKYYANEATFYSRLSAVLSLLLMIAVATIINLIK